MARLRALADERGVPAARLALAWVLAQGDDVVPIPGTRHAAHLASNVAAADLELGESDLATITAAVPASAVLGVRHPQPHLLDG